MPMAARVRMLDVELSDLCERIAQQPPERLAAAPGSVCITPLENGATSIIILDGGSPEAPSMFTEYRYIPDNDLNKLGLHIVVDTQSLSGDVLPSADPSQEAQEPANEALTAISIGGLLASDEEAMLQLYAQLLPHVRIFEENLSPHSISSEY